MRIAVIDASAPEVAVAVLVDGECRFWRQAQVVYGADGFLSAALAEALPELDGMDRVAVTVGPGAFTGLRVGVATALGLALARGVGVACLSSLALRAGLFPEEGEVVALLDARKDRVYAGWYDVRGLQPRLIGAEMDIAPERLLERLAAEAPCRSLAMVGDGAIRYRSLLESAGHRVLERAGACPVAEAGRWIHLVENMPIQQVLLIYLREPDAKIPSGLPHAGPVGT